MLAFILTSSLALAPSQAPVDAAIQNQPLQIDSADAGSGGHGRHYDNLFPVHPKDQKRSVQVQLDSADAGSGGHGRHFDALFPAHYGDQK